jgi:hypothetical protein
MLLGVAIVITAPFGAAEGEEAVPAQNQAPPPEGFRVWAASGEIPNDGVQLIGNSRHPKVIEARPGPNRESKVIKNWKPNSDD